MYSFGPCWIQRFFGTFFSNPSIHLNISTSAKPSYDLVTPTVSCEVGGSYRATKMTVFWDMTPCSLAQIYESFFTAAQPSSILQSSASHGVTKCLSKLNLHIIRGKLQKIPFFPPADCLTMPIVTTFYIILYTRVGQRIPLLPTPYDLSDMTFSQRQLISSLVFSMRRRALW